MYQEIFPHHYDNSYHPVAPSAQDIILCYDDHQAILKDDHSFFTYDDVPHDRAYHYLFQIDTIHYFLGDISDLPCVKINVRTFRHFQPKHLAFAAITGWQLYLWMKENAYCGRCGTKNEIYKRERAMICPLCKRIVYPKIMPAVIVGVINDNNELLVSKYADRAYTKYALIAGFTEIGETIEETVIREVKEETGLDVSDITYYSSQPWSFSSTLLFGFFAHAHGNQTLHMDKQELAELKWITRNDIDVDPHDEASLTSLMIHTYLEGNLE